MTHKGYCCRYKESVRQPSHVSQKVLQTGQGREGNSIFCIIKLPIIMLLEPIMAEVTTHNNHVNHDIIDLSWIWE